MYDWLIIFGLTSAFIFILFFPAIYREEGLINSFMIALVISPLLSLPISLPVWYFTDDAETLIFDIQQGAKIDYIPPFTFDVYRKFTPNLSKKTLCENNDIRSCFSIANDYAIHDNRSRSEYYLRKIISIEINNCKTKGYFLSCENIIKAYKQMGEDNKAKQFKKLLESMRNNSW